MNFNEDSIELWGHGTDEDRAIDIMETGLIITRSDNLTSTALLLNHKDKEKTQDQLEHWQHHDAKYVILVAIPKDGIFLADGIDDPNRYILFCDMVQSPWDEDELYPAIRPEFIYGYYDAENHGIVENAKFYTNLAPEEKKKCDERMKERLVEELNTESFGGIKNYIEDGCFKLFNPEIDFPLSKEEIEKYDESYRFEKASKDLRYKRPYISYENLEKQILQQKTNNGQEDIDMDEQSEEISEINTTGWVM